MSIKKYHKSANLFDYHTMSVGMTGKYLTADGSVGVSDNWNTTDYIPVDSSVFTVGRLGGISPAICLYDENKNFIGGQAYGTGGIGFKEYTTVTAGSVAKFARFSYYTVSDEFYDDLSKIMLVEGSIPPTSYIPYGHIWSQIPYRKYGTETDIIATLPATIIGDGTPISSYIIKGNMEQSGTPTPENPIMPSECGERTENLFDKVTWDDISVTRGTVNVLPNGIELTATGDDAYTQTYATNKYSIPVIEGSTYTLSWNVDNPNIYGLVYVFTGSTVGNTLLATKVASAKSLTFTIPNGHNYLCFRVGIQTSGDTLTYTNIMLNLGSTALPYEPYGYKLPLTLGSTTTNIYLGEVQSERKIKKVVLTGEENSNVTDSTTESGTKVFSLRFDTIGMTDILDYDKVMRLIQYPFFYSSHFKQKSNQGLYTDIKDGEIGANTVSAETNNRWIIFGSSTYTTVESFKSFLAQQYANGTPVTIWYVLAEPTTGIVNEPIRKIGAYVDSVSGTNLATSGTAQELDVDTTLKPSEVDLTYHGWHEHEDTKFTT